MPDGDKQFGKADKMSQDEKPASKGFIKKTLARHVKTMHRHKEHR
jgi:hypothetical protein